MFSRPRYNVMAKKRTNSPPHSSDASLHILPCQLTNNILASTKKPSAWEVQQTRTYTLQISMVRVALIVEAYTPLAAALVTVGWCTRLAGKPQTCSQASRLIMKSSLHAIRSTARAATEARVCNPAPKGRRRHHTRYSPLFLPVLPLTLRRAGSQVMCQSYRSVVRVNKVYSSTMVVP